MALAFPVCSKVYTSTPSSLLGPGLWLEDFWYTQSPFWWLGTEACIQSTLLLLSLYLEMTLHRAVGVKVSWALAKGVVWS